MRSALFEWLNEAKETHIPSLESLAINVSFIIEEAVEEVYGSSTPEKEIMSPEEIEDLFYEIISSRILFLSNQNPSKKLILVLDGIPLRASLPFLRKTYYTRSVLPLIDPNVLLDGSDEMKRIIIHLQTFIKEKRALLPSEITLSSPEAEGLAEEKIFSLITGETLIISPFRISLLLHALQNTNDNLYLFIKDKSFMSLREAKRIIKEKIGTPHAISSFTAALLLLNDAFAPLIPNMNTASGFRAIIESLTEDVVTETADRILWRSYLLFLSRIVEKQALREKEKDKELETDRVRNYLEILNFSYFFYSNGNVTNENKEMSIKYDYDEAPSLLNLINIGKGQITSIVKNETWKQWDKPLEDEEFLSSVLPSHSFRHIMASKRMKIGIKPQATFTRENMEKEERTLYKWNTYLF